MTIRCINTAFNQLAVFDWDENKYIDVSAVKTVSKEISLLPSVGIIGTPRQQPKKSVRDTDARFFWRRCCLRAASSAQFLRPSTRSNQLHPHAPTRPRLCMAATSIAKLTALRQSVKGKAVTKGLGLVRTQLKRMIAQSAHCAMIHWHVVSDSPTHDCPYIYPVLYHRLAP